MGQHYPHLSLDERRKLAKWRNAKIPVYEIAMRLKRAPSTIYREIKRNFYRDEEIPELNGYHPEVAQTEYKERRAVHRKLVRHPHVKAAVVDRLKEGWSPEQIAGRMKLEDHPVRVSHALPGRVIRSMIPRGKRSTGSPTQSWVAQKNFTVISQNIVASEGLAERESTTGNAFRKNYGLRNAPTRWLSAKNLATGRLI